MSEPSEYSGFIKYLPEKKPKRHLLTPEEDAKVQTEQLKKQKELEQITVYANSGMNDYGVHATYIFTLDQEGNICSIPQRFLRWEDDCLTLKQLAKQLRKRRRTSGTFYVWVETPLKGKIYCYGNYGEFWIEYGETQGYA